MNIVLTGSVAYDYLMSFPGYFRDHILPDKLDSISLSFLVESMIRRRGGAASNIAYTLALFGQRSRLMATVGEDFEEYRIWLDSIGVDTSAVKVIPGEFTASFFVNTDRSNAQIASFYPGAMEQAHELSIYDLRDQKPDLIMISPNDPKAMIRYVEECKTLDIPYFYDPSQQICRLDGQTLRKGLEGAAGLFVNDYEFGLIQKHAGMNPTDIRKATQLSVVTRGEIGADVYVGDQVHHIPSVSPNEIADPTGVGDAFRGGFLIGYSNGLNWETCGRMGSLAATYCIEQKGPQEHSFTPEEFINRYRENFDDHNKLDVFIN
ncbi:MAG: carbohydrate kinase family protein [Anaerolineales bacterium]|jgi:adenosine kinase